MMWSPELKGANLFTNGSSPQPTYAFGCTCLVLIGYLIHRKYVSPWLAAIASTSNLSLSLPTPLLYLSSSD
jgi:hypothetical protein